MQKSFWTNLLESKPDFFFFFSDFTPDFFIHLVVKVYKLWWTNFCWSFVLQTLKYSLSASRVPVLQSVLIKGLQSTESLWRRDANWQLSFCCSKSVWYCQLIFIFSSLFPLQTKDLCCEDDLLFRLTDDGVIHFITFLLIGK